MANWTADDIPDQSDRVIIITGANTGLGYKTAEILAKKGARIILACRSEEKGKTAVENIKADNADAKVELQLLDLSDLDSVKKFSDEFASKNDKLDLLILNAGVMVPPQSKTKQGFELQFGVNHLAHFALTGHLLPLLNETEGARVVVLSSSAANLGVIDFDDLQCENKSYKPFRVYGQSKLANQLFTLELQKRLSEAGKSTIVTACHPGYTRTDLQRTSYLFSVMGYFLGQETEMGVLPTLRAATDPECKGAEYFGPNGRMEWTGYPVAVEMEKLAKNEEDASRLWDVSEELTGVKYEF